MAFLPRTLRYFTEGKLEFLAVTAQAAMGAGLSTEVQGCPKPLKEAQEGGEWAAEYLGKGLNFIPGAPGAPKSKNHGPQPWLKNNAFHHNLLTVIPPPPPKKNTMATSRPKGSQM